MGDCVWLREKIMKTGIGRLLPALGVVLVGLASALAQEGDDGWISKIRKDHPRLFFNKDTWPAVKARALGPEKERYEEIKKRVDKYPDDPQGRSGGAAADVEEKVGGKVYKMAKAAPAKEWGKQAMETAFVYLVTGDRKYLEKTKKMLEVSIGVYHKCYAERRAVNWYSTTRVCALAAFDWIYNDLTPEERKAILLPLLKHIDDVQKSKPKIHRRNGSSYTSGFYGVRNIVWFAGLAAYDDGIDDALAVKFLKQGYDYNQKLFEYRKTCAGDDGGLASATVGYAMCAYPWSQFNFLHTWRSAIGENVAPKWPHLAYFPVWIMWNWIPAETRPKEFGSGDTNHYTNNLPWYSLYGHMSQIMHFYGQSDPDCAALAAYIRTVVSYQRFAGTWPMYPFLMTDIDKAPPPKDPSRLKVYGRHFETLGQIFMRSGTGLDDTFCLFTIGSRVPSHKQFDENSFIIYKKGFLALDSGTRGISKDFNLRHYYAQTVAHNCILIHMPDEPLPRYWGPAYDGPEGKLCHGGMNKTTGATVAAFDTNEHYTYVAGDATACYSDKKCRLALRQFLFVMPDTFVICDRVTSTKPECRKEWLLHTQNEPVVEGKQFRADEGEGRLFCRVLLPKDAVLKKVGGPGKEFWASGKNWELNDAVKAANAKHAKKRGKPYLLGSWRMETHPTAARTEDVFLHLVQVGDQSLEQMVTSELIEADGCVGVAFQAGDKSVRVTFGTSGAASGHVRIASGDTVLLDEDLRQDVLPQQGLGVAAK